MYVSACVNMCMLCADSKTWLGDRLGGLTGAPLGHHWLFAAAADDNDDEYDNADDNDNEDKDIDDNDRQTALITKFA